MNNTEKQPIPPLEIINANTLLSTDYPPLQFAACWSGDHAGKNALANCSELN